MTHESGKPVVIVGGGLAALCCARRLREANVPVLVLEASDEVGGRIRTDKVDGFTLDRGFQVLQTAYPEARRSLDYNALNLKPFYPGSLVRTRGGRMAKLVDPWRKPLAAIASLVGGVGTLRDKLAIARLRSEVLSQSYEQIFAGDNQPTIDLLREWQFSDTIIDGFFRPWFGGVFFDPDLQTSSRFFRYAFRNFAAGDSALPAAGMQAIPTQLASPIRESIRLQCPVAHVEGTGVVLEDGASIAACAVVIATDAWTAQRLTHMLRVAPPACATTCFYFDAPAAPVDSPVLVLNGTGEGPINNLCVPSHVAPSYAPAGRHLVSVSVVGDAARSGAELEPAVRTQLESWFGSEVEGWRRLATYAIPLALPAQGPEHLSVPERSVRLSRGLYLCGDHVDNASINGAMLSGKRAAEALLADFAEGGRA